MKTANITLNESEIYIIRKALISWSNARAAASKEAHSEAFRTRYAADADNAAALYERLLRPGFETVAD